MYSKAANVDWQKVVLNLRTAGMPVNVIRRRTGIDQATLARFARGETKEPRFSRGLRLLDLHLAVCPDQHAELI